MVDIPSDPQERLQFLESSITENKREKINQVLDSRTRHIVVALEDIFQSQNASAVLRTCDCFGVQDAHVIENYNKYVINKDVTNGSERWVDIVRYNHSGINNSVNCIETLRQQGYQIAATTLNEPDCFLEDLPVDRKTAVFFGTEMEGISSTVLERADYRVKIPMYGFTQSFNISVSAAIILYRLTSRIREEGIDWFLTEEEKRNLRLKWYERISRVGNHR